MQQTITRITAALCAALAPLEPSVYLYGSAAQGDFRPGWSDIDLLALTSAPLTAAQAQTLLTLRQDIPVIYPDAIHARACEGCVTPLQTLTKNTPATSVYWGTSGQRITDAHRPDVFCLWQLQHGARLLHGPDVRALLPDPAPSALHEAVAGHLRTILLHGRGAPNLYAFGWLLDTARGLYTIRHDAVIAKTAAGEWALAQGLCPDEASLQLALAVRRDPALIHQEEVQRHAASLTPAIARFAGVLQRELTLRGIRP